MRYFSCMVHWLFTKYAMYWQNPLVQVRWPCAVDPFIELLKNDHCLYWNAEFDHRSLHTNQSLQDLCDWANHGLITGADAMQQDQRNHYDLANLVKLNLWTRDIQQQGIVKPWLILDWGTDVLEAGNGDSRLRILEILCDIKTVPAFISTHRSRNARYRHLTPVNSFDEFAALCRAEMGQEFLFRPTAPDAAFGIYWYEFDSSRTRAVTPSEPWCVSAFVRYHQQHPDVKIEPEWFLTDIDWQLYHQ